MPTRYRPTASSYPFFLRLLFIWLGFHLSLPSLFAPFASNSILSTILETDNFLRVLCSQTGKIVQFSEQEMVDCVKNGANTCDVGGYMEDVYEELIQHHGGKIQTEDQYPYTGKSLKKCKSDDSNAVGEFTGYVTLPNGDEKALLTAAYQRPVVAVAIDASAFSFQFYSSGVYNEPNCKKLYDELDHGVSVVGYGTDAKGGDYWIVRNSWGGSWGQKGYIWMSRNKDNQCGIATDASYPLWGPNKSLRRV